MRAFIGWLNTQRVNAEKARNLADRQLAQARWLAAQDARGAIFASNGVSSLKATHYLLRAAVAEESAGDKLAARNSILAWQFTTPSLVATLVHDRDVFGATYSPDGRQV